MATRKAPKRWATSKLKLQQFTLLRVVGIALIIGIVAYAAAMGVSQTGLLSSSPEASSQQCPIAKTYGCFTVNSCNRDGFGIGDESSCYRYINYTCHNGQYAGKSYYLNPMSACWRREEALLRISELCGCEGRIEKTVKCDETFVYLGSRGTTRLPLDLGEEMGTVQIDFEAYSNPDRFRVIYNGIEKVNTGFRGKRLDPPHNYAQLLDDHFAPRNNEPLITEPGKGSVTFTKDSSEQNAILEVEAPLINTLWEVSVKCPAR